MADTTCALPFYKRLTPEQEGYLRREFRKDSPLRQIENLLINSAEFCIAETERADAAEAAVATLTAERDAARAERDAAAEDERDRLLQLAEDRQDDTSDDERWKQAVEAGCFLEDNGAMPPADRAALRALAAQEAQPHG